MSHLALLSLMVALHSDSETCLHVVMYIYVYVYVYYYYNYYYYCNKTN